jgi:hypothetical protein
MQRKTIVRVGVLVGSAAALGLLIFGIAAFSAPKGASTPSIDRPVSGDPLVGSASAPGAGGTTSQLASAGAGAGAAAGGITDPSLKGGTDTGSGSGGSGSDGGTGTGGGTGGSTTVKVVAPKNQLPVTVAGMDTLRTVGDAASAQTAFEPQGRSPVNLVTATVFDRKTAAGAQKFLTGVTKRVYSKSGTTVNVAGHPGWFGTDGDRLATIAFTNGRYVYEVIVSVPGGNPAAQRAVADRVAVSFRIP